MSDQTMKFGRGRERGIVVPLPRTGTALYGGIFSGWYARKGGEFGPSLSLKALVTHREIETEEGVKWKALEEITEAVCFISSNDDGEFPWRISLETGPTQLLGFMASVLRIAPAELEAITHDADIIHHFNEAVGKGFIFNASITTKKDGTKSYNTIDKKTVYGLNSTGNAAFAAIYERMREKLTIKADKSGNKYLFSPQPTTMDENESKRLSTMAESAVQKAQSSMFSTDKDERHVVDTATGEILKGEAALDALLEDEVPF